MVGWPSEADISYIMDNRPITRKYRLATLQNYSNKFTGRKVNILYLQVEMLLLSTYGSLTFVISFLSGWSSHFLIFTFSNGKYLLVL